MLCVLDKPRVDYTLARGRLRRGAQLGAIGPHDIRPALVDMIISLIDLIIVVVVVIII